MTMKKETIKTITIIVLMIFSITCMLFAFAQKVKADQNAELASQQAQIAQYAQMDAEEQAQRAQLAQAEAEKAAAEAIKQHEIAEEAIKNCK